MISKVPIKRPIIDETDKQHISKRRKTVDKLKREFETMADKKVEEKIEHIWP